MSADFFLRRSLVSMIRIITDDKARIRSPCGISDARTEGRYLRFGLVNI